MDQHRKDMNLDVNRKFNKFLLERSKILDDIKQFLNMVLTFLSQFPHGKWKKIKKSKGFKVQESLAKLMESLCFMHALYGYPKSNPETIVVDKAAIVTFLSDIEEGIKEKTNFVLENDSDSGKPRKRPCTGIEFVMKKRDIENRFKRITENKEKVPITLNVTYDYDVDVENVFYNKFKDTLTTVNKDAVKTLVEDMTGENGEKFSKYCSQIDKENFWKEFNFFQEECLLANQVREPARIYQLMIKDMFSENPEAIDVYGKKLLSSLPKENCLKPAVWAERKNENNGKEYGVSLGD
ncbi:uncharacterized protein LOC114522705 [Dendronephthya gigantea]|uniref:uncharacterized protein LOC114522705 n=1 Tax=Dendronephthya gigantea TaxID=151771 RepID=UPI00106B2BAF|nr:uncharacterized protein LOC114522705 [Dendronephthya gigantea]